MSKIKFEDAGSAQINVQDVLDRPGLKRNFRTFLETCSCIARLEGPGTLINELLADMEAGFGGYDKTESKFIGLVRAAEIYREKYE